MVSEVTLDFSRVAPKRRKRSKRDTARFWDVRYGAFLKSGFTDEEAKWGADNGLSLKDSQVKQIRRHRRDLVAWYMSRYGYTRIRAIEEASHDLETKLEMVGETELNLFYEVSP